MKETLKEKRIRFMLIGFFVLITVSAFFIRQEKVQHEWHAPRAAVLHESIDEQDHAIVALYEYKEKQHVLGIYEMDRTNQYKFNAITVLSLDKSPDELRPDKKGMGVWVLAGDKWSYYTKQLELKKKALKAENVVDDKEPFVFDQNNSAIILKSGQSIALSEKEHPIEVHALSADSSLLLIVTDEGIKIAANN